MVVQESEVKDLQKSVDFLGGVIIEWQKKNELDYGIREIQSQKQKLQTEEAKLTEMRNALESQN